MRSPLPTAGLREEHQRLRTRLASMRALADHFDEVPADEVVDQLGSALTFLEESLVPFGLAEEGLLYPAVALAMGASQATATMSRDHLEIIRMTEQLRHLVTRFRHQESPRLRRDLRRVLIGIDAVAELHLDKEEEIYLPLLDADLTDEAAAELVAQVLAAAERATPRPRTPGGGCQ
jgi:iron-sulfur cluster repair protein YtfE (RIC family)